MKLNPGEEEINVFINLSRKEEEGVIFDSEISFELYSIPENEHSVNFNNAVHVKFENSTGTKRENEEGQGGESMNEKCTLSCVH